MHLECVVSREKGGKKPTFSCEKTSAEREEDLKRVTTAQSRVSANRSSTSDPRRISMLEKVSCGSLRVKRPTVHPSDGGQEAAESAAALHHRVSLVHNKLEAHINEEERMQSLNKDLREKYSNSFLVYCTSKRMSLHESRSFYTSSGLADQVMMNSGIGTLWNDSCCSCYDHLSMLWAHWQVGIVHKAARSPRRSGSLF